MGTHAPKRTADGKKNNLVPGSRGFIHKAWCQSAEQMVLRLSDSAVIRYKNLQRQFGEICGITKERDEIWWSRRYVCKKYVKKDFIGYGVVEK